MPLQTTAFVEKVDIASCLEKKRDVTIRLTANVEVKLYIMKHSKDHQWNCLNYASRGFLLFSKLLTFSMLNSVDRPKGWNPVSEQYDVYSWTSLGAITFLTTLGISSVSPSESFNFFVPYAKSCKKDGLETKSRKWSTFAGCNLLRLICGGSILDQAR